MQQHADHCIGGRWRPAAGPDTIAVVDPATEQVIATVPAGTPAEVDQVVYGLGGIGLAVLQAARIAGAGRIIAVDVAPGKEELARQHGATDFLIADDRTPKAVRELTGGLGADHAFECVGRGAAIRSAWSATRRGGRTTVVGIGGKEDEVSFSALELFHYARTLTACVFGNCDPVESVPVLAGHVRSGRLDLDALITDRIGLADIPAAFERMTAGRGGRSLVVFDG
ncbi:hypothetical protein GCM10025734_19710 [Kitasatospora paranensis]